MASPFVWGAGGAQLTPEQIAQQQKVARALMDRASDTSPVRHWSQGANRVLQGLIGGYEDRVADEATKANADENKALIASLFGGMSGGTAPVATAAAPAPLASNPPSMTGGMPSPVAMAPSVNNKIYSNDEPSPLDPPSGRDRDMAIRTVFGEDPGSSALGVANVIRNRAVAGKFGGDTIPGVVLAKNQFEPWNNDAARARMQSLDPNSPTYKRLGGIVDEAYTGLNDPTNGATHFFAPKAQAALGRDVPAWGRQGGQDIGVHRFFGGAANPTMVATNAVPPAMGARPGAPVQPSQTTWGDREAEAAGLYETPATVAQRSVGAPGAPADQAALPANATPAQYVAPGTGEVIAPAAPAVPARPQMNPANLAAIMTNPRASPQVQKIAAMMFEKSIASQGVTTVDLGNEVGVMDKAGNIVRRLPKGEPNKGPSFVDGPFDPTTGQPTKVWVDPKDKSVTPYRLPTDPNAPASAIPPAPPGVDPKVWREAQSKRATETALPASFDDTTKVRNEIQGLPSYKNIAQAAPVYKSMLQAAGRDTRAADVNLIYGLAKIMDPGSVVRESEMTVAQAVATIPQQLRATVESQLTGAGRLTPEVRAALMQEAHGRMGSYQEMFNQDAGMYRNIAKNRRMNEGEVVPSFGPFDEYKPAPPAVVTKPGTVAPPIAKGQTKTGVQWSVQ